MNASEYETNLSLGTCPFLMVIFYNILFFPSFQYKNCPVFVLWAPLRKYVIGNKSPILRGLLPRLIVPNGNKWNSCPLLMICCQPISSMVIAHSKENGSIHRNIIIWRFWGPWLFFQTNYHTAWTVLYAPILKHCQTNKEIWFYHNDPSKTSYYNVVK